MPPSAAAAAATAVADGGVVGDVGADAESAAPPADRRFQVEDGHLGAAAATPARGQADAGGAAGHHGAARPSKSLMPRPPSMV